MRNKFNNKFQKIKQKLNNINEEYINYFLCISFLTVILFKINSFFFQISIIYLYLIIIILSITFINQWLYIIYNLKNTYYFNYFLYYFLIIKNNIYKSIFYYFKYVENEKNTKLIIFLTGFVFSSWFFNVFFFIINNYYDLTIIMFFFLLFLNLFNLIEKKLIFNEKNLLKINQEMDYDHVRSFLKINNKKFIKNSSLFYLQKRYTHFHEFKTLVQKHGITIISSAAAGTIFTSVIQIKKVNLQLQQLDFMQIQHNDIVNRAQEQMHLTNEQLKIQKKKIFYDYLLDFNKKIKDAHHEDYKLQKNMDNHYCGNKINLYDAFKDLRNERDLLKITKTEADEKKQTLDDFFFDEE